MPPVLRRLIVRDDGYHAPLLCADLVNESFLRQSAYSDTDRYCSPARQTAMMRLIARFIELAEDALDAYREIGAMLEQAFVLIKAQARV
jgi:vacuolar-type H+-ATPase catalytic subunit A/Vma1